MKYYRINVTEYLTTTRKIVYSFTVTCSKKAATILTKYRKRGLCTMKVEDA